MTFDAFWAAYPRKVGKHTARQAWDKIVRKGTDPAVILQGVRLYIADKSREDWRAWCHPTTFLNQRRWEDYEPSPVVHENVIAMRLVNGCELPPDIPDGSTPTRMTLDVVEWALPNGERAERPRFWRRVQNAIQALKA